MVNIFKRLTKKTRKYPIKKGKYGRSARRRAFQLFDFGRVPTQVYSKLDISLRTARRYYADWKKLPGKYSAHYKLAKHLRRNRPDIYYDMVRQVADELKIPVETLIERLQKPWARRHSIMGEVVREFQAERMQKNIAVFEAAIKVLERKGYYGLSPNKVFAELERFLHKKLKEMQT